MSEGGLKLLVLQQGSLFYEIKTACMEILLVQNLEKCFTKFGLIARKSDIRCIWTEKVNIKIAKNR